MLAVTGDEALYQRLAAGLGSAPGATAVSAAFRLLPICRDPAEAARVAAQEGVDVLLVDSRLQPSDPAALVRALSDRAAGVPIAILADPQNADLIRRALAAGARSFLPITFAPESLQQLVADLTSVKEARPESSNGAAGHVVVVLSLKGGVGRTLLATNLAVALRGATNRPVALVDGQILNGDTEIDLNLRPQHTIADLAGQVDHLDPNLVDEALTQHSSGIRVLAATGSPELAERVGPTHLSRILGALRRTYSWVVVDTGSAADERMDAMLDVADTVLVLTTPEFTALRATRIFLQAARQQDYPQDKLRLVVNRADLLGAVPLKEIERNLDTPVTAQLVDDSALVTFSVNRGVPLVMSHARKPLARSIVSLAQSLIAEVEPAKPPRRGLGLFRRDREG